VKRQVGIEFGKGVAAALMAIAMALPISAQALFLQMELIDGNDCAGVFGKGFSNCRVPGNGSPSIIKFDDGLGVEEISVNYPTIDGTEFGFSGLGSGNASGTWTYTPDNVGIGEDPAVKFWTAKAGPEFYLFYVTAADTMDRSVAIAVNTGDWVTPDGKDLSHITFYDTGDFPTVDEPATLVLLGLSLLGLGLSRRRKITCC
jgi:hypothetical protein